MGLGVTFEELWMYMGAPGGAQSLSTLPVKQHRCVGTSPATAAKQESEPGNGGAGGRAGTDGWRERSQHHLLNPLHVQLRPPRSTFSGFCTPPPNPPEHPSRRLPWPPLPWLPGRCCESPTCVVSQGKR